LRTGAVRFSADGEPIHHCHGVSSFSEFTLVTEEVAIPITDEIPLEQASLLGCGVFTGVGAVANTADVELGSSVVIFGAGGVGLSAVQGARLRGAGDIVVVDLVAEKLELAEQLGATETVDASKEDTVERVRSVLGGGADYAFDIVGIPEIVEEAIAVLAPTGTAVLVGTAAPGKNEHSLNMMDMVLGEQEIVGSFNGSYNLSLAIPKLAELVAKDDLHLDPLITDFRGLRELNEAMDDLEHGSHIRQVIKPN
jgi:S-(hydroxymethyl)glutathione dehydrogenase/alcohol dehydrogenase